MAVKLDNKTPLGKLILKNLYLMGKNQAWLAEQLGIPLSNVSTFCSKPQHPKIDTLLKYSKILNIEMSELLNAVLENEEIH